MAQFLAPIINEQTFDANGDPLVGGTISVYLAGSSTPATTTSDQAGAVPNTWPITLNTLGLNSQGAVWMAGGFAYKFVIKDASGATLRTIDNVSGMNDTTVALDQWVLFQGTPTYVSATSFTLPGDQTQTFPFGRRIKTANTAGIVYATVIRSAFSTSTTVTVLTDSGALDSGLSSVSVGLVTAQNSAIPGTITLAPFRNRAINGSFRSDQRNGGSAQTITSGGAIAYTMDRFYVSCTGANVTTQRVAGTGYRSAFTITGAASNTGTLFGQRFELANVFDWVGRQVYVQVPISAVGITSLTWNAYTADVADVFSAKTLIATGTLSVNGTIETKFFSFNAGANASRGIAIEIVSGALTAGQSITYQGAFQAEANQVTTFEYVEIGEEVRRCQRYTEVFPSGALDFIGSNATAGQNNSYTVPMKVTKRATPTFTSTWTTSNVTSVGLSVAFPQNVSLAVVNTAAGQWRITSNSISVIDAEL